MTLLDYLQGRNSKVKEETYKRKKILSMERMAKVNKIFKLMNMLMNKTNPIFNLYN